MTRFDVDAAIRWGRFNRQRTLEHRSEGDLPFIDRDSSGSQALLLDTCVYIDQLWGRSPAILERVVVAPHVNHSAIGIVELMHGIGVLDPGDSRTSSIAAEIQNLIRRMPRHRICTPDADVLGRAGLLAGVVCRIQGFGKDRRMRALHDCVLFLQAQKLGLTVLTRDIGDFDVLIQLMPAGRVLFYRQKGKQQA